MTKNLALRQRANRDDGDIVQSVLMVAVFVLVALIGLSTMASQFGGNIKDGLKSEIMSLAKVQETYSIGHPAAMGTITLNELEDSYGSYIYMNNVGINSTSNGDYCVLGYPRGTQKNNSNTRATQPITDAYVWYDSVLNEMFESDSDLEPPVGGVCSTLKMNSKSGIWVTPQENTK